MGMVIVAFVAVVMVVIRGTMLRQKVVAPTIEEVRQDNQQEQRLYGDGTHAPYWPRERLNGGFTLRRGVWVDDAAPRQPTDAELDAVREVYQHAGRIVHFTLVEGEQEAPMGPNGQMIRVRASVGVPATVRDRDGQIEKMIPTINTLPVDADADGWWSRSFMGTLPCEMSVRVKSQNP